MPPRLASPDGRLVRTGYLLSNVQSGLVARSRASSRAVKIGHAQHELATKPRLLLAYYRRKSVRLQTRRLKAALFAGVWAS